MCIFKSASLAVSDPKCPGLLSKKNMETLVRRNARAIFCQLMLAKRRFIGEALPLGSASQVHKRKEK